MLLALRLILPAVGALALPATAQETFACQVISSCEMPLPCRDESLPLSLQIHTDGALVTYADGNQIGFDRPVTRTDRRQVRAFAALTLLDTTLLLTQDREAGTLMITEHARDADGPVVITQSATCRPDGG